ncbi:MAG: AAA family ATPase [Planctomycetota bacterium]
MSSLEERYEKGSELLRDRKYSEAIRQFDAALAIDGAHAMSMAGRGLCWHWLGEYENALKDYTGALELDPELVETRMGRGAVLMEQGDLDAALEEFDVVIREDPRRSRAWAYRARLRFQRNEPELSLSDAEEYLRLSPKDADMHVYYSAVLESLERYDDALAAVDEAIRLEPENGDHRAARARIHGATGNLDDLQEDLQFAQNLTASEPMTSQRPSLIAGLLKEHFAPLAPDDLTVTNRQFPHHMRADLQRAVDGIMKDYDHFCGVRREYSHESLSLAELIVPTAHGPATSVPPQYEEMDIGEDEPVRCLKNGLWLGHDGAEKYALLLARAEVHGDATGMQLQVATRNDPAGSDVTQRLLREVEKALLESRCYRGKILSLEDSGRRFFGESTGIAVHKLRSVERDAVILPRKTLELLDRNVIGFARQSSRLSERGLSTKKGVLFYGPPGTGKTHTIHYLASALEGFTTFLITAEQVGYLDEYMSLARLLQPSVVVMEDVDLIAKDREFDDSCGSVLLHKLLNEMDGLRPDAEVVFILTTNRPEVLESALASRPGRIDQAIEFPLPDEEGRVKLIHLYSYGLVLSDDLVSATARRTDRVSASFIKELMRRAAQFQIERGGEDGVLAEEDVDNALEEMLFAGGSLNRKLLGANPDAES